MRSDKNKNADPNRDIDDFLSKFEDVANEDSKDFSHYLEDDPKNTSSKQSFQWKEFEPVKSGGKKDKAERSVVKEPAPSAIKVQRLRPDEDTISTYPIDEVASDKPEKPAAVEPQRASDVYTADKSAGDEDKSSNSTAEVILEEHFGDGNDADVINDEASASGSPDVPSEVSVSDVISEEKHESKLKGLFAFFKGKSDKPEEIEKAETDDSGLFESVEESETSDNESAESPETSDIPDELIDADETAPDSAEDEVPSAAGAIETESELSEETDEAAEGLTADNADPVSVQEEVPSEAVLPAFDLFNKPKSEKTPLATGYFFDPATGRYIKTDLGKRKRIEYKAVSSDTSKAGLLGLFGAKKTKPAKKSGAPKQKKTLAHALFLKKNPKYNPDEGETYELNGKTVKNKPLKFSFLKLIRDFVVVGVLMLLVAVGVGAYVVHNAPAYNYSDIYATVATTSIVYDDEGKQIDNIYYTENRKLVKYEDMPENLVNAFVAIEDKTFWKHHGFNWIRMIGAVFSSITGHGQISGTSTITQQLSRNVYLPEEKSERTLKRKFLEMYYAARIEHALSKEEIMEAYLNTIYLGHGCYGVNSAARTYFSKNVQDLTLLECASLAALPQAPDTYSLLKYANDGGEVSEDSKVVQKTPDRVVTNDISKSRRDLTLDLMLEQELITQEEYNESYDKALNDFIDPYLKSGSGNYTYFHEYLVDTIVADLMEQKQLSFEDAERMVYTGGLQIYSTLDSTAQNVVADEFKDDGNFPFVAAIWRQDGDGNILNNDGKIALYDYDDYFDDDDNFTLSSEDDEIKFNEDGSVTIYKDHDLNIYETEVDGGTDYSIEFKNYYTYNGDEGIIYSIQGGYVNIPAAYKSGDGNGNVIVSADLFNDDNYKNAFKIDGDNLIISETGYSIGQKVRQPQAGMTIVQVGTGEIKAMVGGSKFNGQRLLNRAINSRQPGSSIKPLAVYGAALQKSYELEKEGQKWTYTNYKIDRQGTRGWGDYVTVHSSIEDERTRVNGKYWPLNATRTYTGTNNFRTAIQNSINTCAVKLLYQLTPEYAISQVKKFGITTAVDVEQNDQVNDVNPAAMALGAMTNRVTPLEMSLAYAAFPAGGKVNTPVCYTKILDRNGNLLLEGKSEQTEAMNEGVAWIMTDVLQSVVTRGIAGAAAISEVQVGGKTGTTNDNYDIWFDGFTPSYAAALWIGTDNNIEMSGTSSQAAALWSKIMDQIPKAKEGEYREMPSNVVEKWGDYYTEGTENGLSSWSYAAEKKKARDAAYKKWSSQRENHKKWVVDKKPEKIYETKRYYINEDEKDKYSDKKLYREKDSGKIYYEEKVDTGKMTKEEGHWEYEKGWRDGDFSYTFDGRTYSD